MGSVWGARQAASLQGTRLLLVRPQQLAAPGQVGADATLLQAQRGDVIAVDELGAGPGDLVLVTRSSRCRDLTVGPAIATKDVIIAIVDRAQIHGVETA